MTTKAPPPVREWPAEALEKIAYSSVGSIPTVEPNDRNRLGYHIWRWLESKQGTLAEAVAESGARILIEKEEAVKIISAALQGPAAALQSPPAALQSPPAGLPSGEGSAQAQGGAS
jgi:hypothetical protein